jgi:hypothetical protein
MQGKTTIKIHDSSSSRSPVVPNGRTDRQTDIEKLIIAFPNFMKASKIARDEKYLTLLKGVTRLAVTNQKTN